MGRDTFGPHLAVGGAHIAKVNVVYTSMDCNSANSEVEEHRAANR
jgi:hypothetical protein